MGTTREGRAQRGRSPKNPRPSENETRRQASAPKATRPPALLVKGENSYRDTVEAIKDHIDPGEFGRIRFVKSRKE